MWGNIALSQVCETGTFVTDALVDGEPVELGEERIEVRSGSSLTPREPVYSAAVVA